MLGGVPGAAEAVWPAVQVDFPAGRGPDGHPQEKSPVCGLDPAGGKLVQAGTGQVLSTITLTSGATVSTIQLGLATTSPAVPVSIEEAALS